MKFKMVKMILGYSCLFVFVAFNTLAGDSTTCSPVNVTPKPMGVPIGGVIPWTSSRIPDGFLECRGQYISSSSYPDLVALIGSRVPDLRGEFIRGWDHGRGMDSGRSLRSSQSDAIRNIRAHFVADIVHPGSALPYSGSNAIYDNGSRGGGDTTAEGGSPPDELREYVFDASRVVPTANENRPRNVALMYIIKAR